MASLSIAGPITARVERYFSISLYLLVVIGFATVASTGKLDLPAVVLTTFALAVRGWHLARSREVIIPERWATILTVVYVAFYAADYLLLSQSFVSATVHLVLFSMVVKIFSVHRDRDHLYLAVLAFLQVLAASVLTVDAVFLAAFSVFVLFAVLTFVTFEIKRSIGKSEHTARQPLESAGRLNHALSVTAIVIVAAVFLGATGIFFLLPRVSTAYLSRFAPRNRIVSGFSDNVQLGAIGEIQQSDAVIMRVQVEPGTRLPDDVHWRGVALALFDGQRWSNPMEGVPVSPHVGERFPIGQARRRWSDEQQTSRRFVPPRLVQYRVMLEPVGNYYFFAIPVVEEISGSYRLLGVDRGGSVYNSDGTKQITSYRAVSNLAQPEPDQLRAASDFYPADIAIRYLQLPSISPKVKQLAGQIADGIGTRYDRAVAIERYLRTQYAYTLQLPNSRPRDPIEHFLFERKKGHCEYFASSMAVMLRTLGIPSRVVNGFRGAELNEVSGSYIVRARDAHSWVEAYFPGQGWVTFDPTPPGQGFPPSFLHRAGLYIDAMREFWREWVVNYDFQHQRSLAVSTVSQTRRQVFNLRDAVRSAYERLLAEAAQMHSSIERRPVSWASWIAGSVLVFVVVFNAKSLWLAFTTRRLARAPERAPQQAATIWYARMEKALARRGWRRLPSQTPQEFASAIEDPDLRRAVTNFTEYYERARFAHSAADASRLPELVVSLGGNGKRPTVPAKSH